MNIFFCDIRGTFDGDVSRSEALDIFFSEIAKLGNDLEFCFLSGENIRIVKKYVEEILPYLKKYNISSIKHFADKHEICDERVFNNHKVAKIDKINDYLSYKNVENIYYADDSTSNQFFTRTILKKKFPNAEIISFVPGCISCNTENTFFSKQSGIDGLNEILCNYNKHYQRKR